MKRALGRIHNSNHFWLALATYLLVVIYPMAARAQVDPNLQSRLSTFAPPITVLSPEFSSERLHDQPPPEREQNCQYVRDTGTGSAKRLANILSRLNQKLGSESPSKGAVAEDFLKGESLDPDKVVPVQKKLDVKRLLSPILKRQLTAALQPQLSVAFACNKAQPRTVKITIPFNPTYETNVMRSNTNVYSDGSLGFGGSVLVTGPGARPYDVIGFAATSASARYFGTPSKSFDLLSEQGIYQFYLDARHSDGRGIDATKKEVTNLLTIDTLSVGVQNQTTFLPGLRGETVDLLTPQATLARQNIQIGNDVCYTPAPPPDGKKPPPEISRGGFCTYVDLAVTVSQTFSDVLNQQNASVAGSATLGWRIPDSNWKVTLPLMVTEKQYENVLGGRQDTLFQIGPTASYSLPATSTGGPAVSFSLAVTYNQNYSTVAASAWHGFIVQPALSIAFQPEVPTK